MIEMETILKKFYQGLDEGKFLGRKCPKCGHIEFPPVIACNECGNFETEWVEMSGRATVQQIILPSRMSDPDCEVFQPYGICIIKPEENAREINAIVRGITPENKEELEKMIPFPVKAATYQREGYKAVVYDLDI